MQRVIRKSFRRTDAHRAAGDSSRIDKAVRPNSERRNRISTNRGQAQRQRRESVRRIAVFAGGRRRLRIAQTTLQFARAQQQRNDLIRCQLVWQDGTARRASGARSSLGRQLRLRESRKM